MADGTYKLIKENSGGTYDEKSILAESGKVLGFDANLNPQMITAGEGGGSCILGINNQTGTTYTLVLTDASKIVRCANAGAITLTVPKNSVVAFPVNTVVNIVQSGAGQVTVAPVDGDVTINGYGGLKTGGQYWALSMVKIDTNVWDLYGGIV